MSYLSDFVGGWDGKASTYNAGDLDSIPGSERSPGEGNGNPLQYSCLENPMDRGAWWATVHGVAKSGTRLSNFTIWMKIGFIGMLCIYGELGGKSVEIVVFLLSFTLWLKYY